MPTFLEVNICVVYQACVVYCVCPLWLCIFLVSRTCTRGGVCSTAAETAKHLPTTKQRRE